MGRCFQSSSLGARRASATRSRAIRRRCRVQVRSATSRFFLGFGLRAQAGYWVFARLSSTSREFNPSMFSHLFPLVRPCRRACSCWRVAPWPLPGLSKSPFGRSPVVLVRAGLRRPCRPQRCPRWRRAGCPPAAGPAAGGGRPVGTAGLVGRRGGGGLAAARSCRPWPARPCGSRFVTRRGLRAPGARWRYAGFFESRFSPGGRQSGRLSERADHRLLRTPDQGQSGPPAGLSLAGPGGAG